MVMMMGVTIACAGELGSPANVDFACESAGLC